MLCSFLIGGLSSCSNETSEAGSGAEGSAAKVFNKTLKEAFCTANTTVENVISPVVWHGSNGENWIIAASPANDKLAVYDAITGSFIKTVCSSGSGENQLRAPHAVSVAEDLIVVVESGNKRAQVFLLPDFKSLGFFGANELQQPTGIAMYKMAQGRYTIYIADNYNTADGKTPADSELGKRIHQYEMNYFDGDFRSRHVLAFGETSGEGAVKSVGEIYVDPLNYNLLVADTDESQQNIKVYNTNGKFTGKVIPKFASNPDGIALYSNFGAEGFWIITDKGDKGNMFHVLERKSFEEVGSFTSEQSASSFAVCATDRSYGAFKSGACLALAANGNLACYPWDQIVKNLNLKEKKSEETASL